MRDILFRGKRKDNGEWVDGNLFIPDLPNKPTQICMGTNVVRITFDIDPETVGQFTGLTDKNGTNIFEGDILLAKVYETKTENVPVWGKNKVRTGNKIDVVWTVEYKNFMTSCGYFIYGKDRRFHRLLTESVIFNNDCEVIGNIHDSPELLEKER